MATSMLEGEAIGAAHWAACDACGVVHWVSCATGLCTEGKGCHWRAKADALALVMPPGGEHE